jgi:regulatory protein
MRVEILPSQEKRGVLLLSVEEEFYREIHTSIFGKHPKFAFIADDISAQFLKKEIERVKVFVLRRLSQRQYSSFELERQLKDRLVSEHTIHHVFEECRRLGYLDDKSWLENYIRSLMTAKAGPRMMVAKLRSKGVPQSFYGPVLDRLATRESQVEGVQKLLQTRYRSRDLTDYKEKQKVIAALLRKGFDFEIVQSCLLGCVIN